MWLKDRREADRGGGGGIDRSPRPWSCRAPVFFWADCRDRLNYPLLFRVLLYRVGWLNGSMGDGGRGDGWGWRHRG